MVFRLQLVVSRDVDNIKADREPSHHRLEPRQRLVTQATTRPGEEGQPPLRRHYRASPMRPATAAVIIGLLVLILGSSLIWLLRSF